MAGELARTCLITWTNDRSHVVLEISDEKSKGTSDSERCSWRALFHEFEDQGITDATINSHEMKAPVAGGGKRLFSA